MNKILLSILAALTFCVVAYSQNMAITSFRCLETDMDARSIFPVYDQNHKKAALIKIVTIETGFDFDIGIMGVTAVKQEIGEIWVYIPEQSYKITIRHNEYGIIRDYVFPVGIKSASVYEMKLETKKTEVETVHIIDTVYTVKETISTPVKEKPYIHVLAAFGVGAAFSYGAMVGVCNKKIGGYLNFHGNFVPDDVSGECKSDGSMPGGTIWTTSESRLSRYSATAGIIVPILNWLNAFGGAGYGQMISQWQDVNKNWIKVTDKSHRGFIVEAGLIFDVRHFDLLCGFNLTEWSYPELTLGIGYRF